MKIAVIDPVSPKQYDPRDPTTLKGLGGSEGSLSRLIRRLESRGHNIKFHHGEHELHYKPKAIVVQRSLAHAILYKEKHPGAKVILWNHDIPGGEFSSLAHVLSAMGIVLVCVSDWHRNQLVDRMLRGRVVKPMTIRRIYNIVEDLSHLKKQHNSNKIVFVSSPAKGLDQTIETFKAINHYFPTLELHIANPGYSPSYDKNVTQLHNHGILTHSECMEMMSDALSIFTCNRVFPETMGLVFAEANSMGVPFIAHAIGAMREIAGGETRQLIDTTKIEEVCNTIESFQKNRPQVTLQDAFKSANVLDEWERLLNE